VSVLQRLLDGQARLLPRLARSRHPTDARLAVVDRGSEAGLARTTPNKKACAKLIARMCEDFSLKCPRLWRLDPPGL
jgi:hypothetical protein